MPYTVLGALGKCELLNGCTSTNSTALLTLNNCVILCGDYAFDATAYDMKFAKLPREEMFPEDMIRVPVMCEVEFLGNPCYVNTYMDVDTEGNMSVPLNGTVTVKLENVIIPINSRYYNDVIGNNTGEGTSPLSTQ